MGISFNIKIPEKILRERNVDDFGIVQKKLDTDVLNYCQAYVPKKSGALIRSGFSGTKIGSGNITYSAPYARYQYYGKSKTGKPLHYSGGGLRGAYWFERMKSTSKYKLLVEAAILAGGKALPQNVVNVKDKIIKEAARINSRTLSLLKIFKRGKK